MSMRVVSLPISNSGDMSQATVTVGPFDVRSKDAAAIQITWTGSPTGSMQLQGTTGNPGSDTNQKNTWPGPWSSIGSAVSLPASSGATSWMWDIVNTGASAVQIVYTKTSGTGTITVANGQQKS